MKLNLQLTVDVNEEKLKANGHSVQDLLHCLFVGNDPLFDGVDVYSSFSNEDCKNNVYLRNGIIKNASVLYDNDEIDTIGKEAVELLDANSLNWLVVSDKKTAKNEFGVDVTYQHVIGAFPHPVIASDFIQARFPDIDRNHFAVINKKNFMDMVKSKMGVATC